MGFAVLVSPDAEVQLAAALAWWATNRAAAPRLLATELRRALDRLATFPNAGVLVKHPLAVVRCVMLTKVGYRVFYRVDESVRRVDVLAVWQAQRGDLPSLP